MKEVSHHDIQAGVEHGPDVLSGETYQSQKTVVPPRMDPAKIALYIITVAVVVAALKLAKDILIPFVLCLVISYALEPVVVWLERRKVSRAIGSFLILSLLTAGLVYGVYTLRDDALAMVDRVPEAAQKVRRVISSSSQWQGSILEKLREAGRELERAAKEATGVPLVESERVARMERPRSWDLSDYLWWGSKGVVDILTQATLIFFFVYFLLISGNLYRRKIMKLMGTSLSRKKVALQLMNEISSQVERFLLAQLLVCVIVGVSSGVAYYFFGLRQAILWGVLSGLFTLIPYVGAMIITLAVGIMGILQFGSLTTAVYLVFATIAIRTIEGFFLVPWLMSRATRMNGVAIFAALMFWAWVWGIAGLFLAVPMMVILKSICDRTRQLKPVGELLQE